MCGIGAFQIVEQEINARRLAQALLRGLTVRGRDASGVAWHDDNERQTYIQKMDMSGVELADGLAEDIGATAIIHTRYATKGDPSNQLNNHPIDVRGIIGVHNGHISNDDELFKDIHKIGNYKRQGQVDSEAAFAWLAHGDKTNKDLYQRLRDIRGGAALMWLNTRGANKYLHVARLSSSPLVFGQTHKGSVVLASTRQILLQSAKECGIEFEFVYELKEGEYIRFCNGRLVQQLTWERPVQPRYVMPDYSKRTLF
jgi:glucosamine 6-phosphate synthetase-like amidotransferase/phosphosugar isomerase protein